MTDWIWPPRPGPCTVRPMQTRRNDDLAVVVYDGLTTLEYAIPTEVFGLERPEVGELYRLSIVAAEPGPLSGAFGVDLRPDGDLDLLASVGTIVVPGWRDRFERPPEPFLAALAAAHDNGARLVSICSGAFVLAAAGVLDGRRATTHWMYTDDLAARHPAVLVDRDALYVDQGSVLTSAGSAAGIDTCLHLVREDWGAAIATAVARRLVVSPHRDGGQAQHIASPMPASDGGSELAALLGWVEEHISRPHTLETLAARVNQSPRTFRRHFARTTGTTPGRWLIGRRVARARELLETTDLSVEQVASAVGLGAATSLRHHFRATLQTTPTAYRSAYRQAATR